MNEPNKVEMVISGAVLALFAGVGLVVGIGYVVWFLVEEAMRGNGGAIAVLVFLGTISIIVIAFFLFGSTLWVNQKQDERAMASSLKLMQTNAMENMALLEQQQKTMLLQSRTTGQNVQNDVRTLQLLNQIQQLQAGQPQPDNFFITDDKLYTNLLEAETGNNND